jgi:uncharacterized damage-inducible protein DinB
MTPPLEPWLRGPVAGIEPFLQPVAHALMGVAEDLPPLLQSLTEQEMWETPGVSAPIGYHLWHMTGSLDRLLTYARGETLSPAQWDAYAAEQKITELRPARTELIDSLTAALDRSIGDLRGIRADALLEPREVGRARRPSNVLGLLVHAAEHTVRHAGQIVTLSRVLRPLGPPPA